MTITTLSGREFKQNISDARKAANNGPVFITDRGRPAHVLLSIEEYWRIAGSGHKIADLLAMPGSENVELEIRPLCDYVTARDLPMSFR